MPRLVSSLLLLTAGAVAGVLAQRAGLPATVRSWFVSRPEVRQAGDLVLGRDGVWHQARDLQSGALDVDNEDLANLPYLRGTRSANDVQTILRYDPDAAADGVNLVVSGHAPEAVLFDMKGNVLHRWRRPLKDVWPGPLGFDEWEVHGQFWRRAHLFPNGDLLAIFEGIGMIKLDLHSNVLWESKCRAHHDLEVQANGEIYTLARHPRSTLDGVELDAPLIEDFVVVLGADGTELRRVSVLDCFMQSRYASLLSGIKWRGDVLHVNTVEVLDGRFADRLPAFTAGRVLISVPTRNVVAVLDLETQQVVWALAGLWVFQHQPTMLDDGSMLVFDNMGANGESRVLQLDPSSQRLLWSYGGTAEQPLASRILGSVSRLDNGNTLITESVGGRALEVTTDGDVVWEFMTPFRAGDDNELIASLLEVERLDPAAFEGELATVVAGLAGDGEGEIDLQGADALLRGGK